MNSGRRYEMHQSQTFVHLTSVSFTSSVCEQTPSQPPLEVEFRRETPTSPLPTIHSEWQGTSPVWALHVKVPGVAGSRRLLNLADLSVQTGAGERIGDLLLAAKVARKSTAKITCPTSRWRIENRLQRQSAFPPAPDASAATVAARVPGQVAVRTFIVR